MLQRREHYFGGHLRGQVPAHDSARASTAPGGQVAPAPAGQWQVGDIPDPDRLGRVDAGWFSSRFAATARAARVGTERPQPAYYSPPMRNVELIPVQDSRTPFYSRFLAARYQTAFPGLYINWNKKTMLWYLLLGALEFVV